jgi:hypothetical protein
MNMKTMVMPNSNNQGNPQITKIMVQTRVAELKCSYKVSGWGAQVGAST